MLGFGQSERPFRRRARMVNPAGWPGAESADSILESVAQSGS